MGNFGEWENLNFYDLKLFLYEREREKENSVILSILV